MKIRRFAVGASMATVALMLSACGGGGVGSTPNPTPTPTPTPTPGPTPTPTPTPTNDDLIAPLVSETFKNFTHSASATYENTGGPITNQSAGKQNGSIRYDAARSAYVITVDGRSQTFASGQYHKVNGSITDDLTLTPAGEPGGGSLRYRYAGAAFWQRQDAGSSTTRGWVNSIVYGIPSASRPVSGTAAYAVNVLGAINTSDPWPDSFSGRGALLVDFRSGEIGGNAEFKVYRPDGDQFSYYESDGAINIDAKLAASSVNFSGDVVVHGPGTYEGTIDGGFFGPNGVELGASYSATAQNGNVLVGALLGVQDPSLTVIPLSELSEATDFYGAIGGGAAHLKVLSYDPATRRYTVPDFATAELGPFTLGPTQIDMNQPDARFTAYSISKDGYDARIKFYRSGSANPEVALTYASFATVAILPAASDSEAAPYFREIIYGSRTPSALLPKIGVGTYIGVLHGNAQNNSDFFTAHGTANFRVEFANSRVLVDLHPFLTNIKTGDVRDFGVHSGSGTFERSRSTFTGNFDGDGSTMLTGYFFGPKAEEVGLAFALREMIEHGNTLHVLGVAVGKKD